MEEPVPSYTVFAPEAIVVSTNPEIEPETNEETLPTVSSPDTNADAWWLRFVRKQLDFAARKQPHRRRRQWTIFRVPEHIRRGDPKAYEPLVVSLGPYHHRPAIWRWGSSSSTTQDHKWQCVRYLLSRHGSRDRAGPLLDRCLSKMAALDRKVRSCYSDNVVQGAHDLALTMLLDGCFLIHLLLKQAKRDGVEEEVVAEIGEEEVIESPALGILWIWNLVVYDLLKLENQIPFFVVQTLFDILATPADEGLDLPELALQLFRDIHPNVSRGFAPMPASQVHHLLHLFHSSLVPSSSQPSYPETHAKKAPPEWIPSATELTRSGIKFKTNEAAGSFLDVSFEDGVMAIPPLRVYDYTDPLLRNLIAFEQCYPNTGTYVTIYAAFMDCIVDGGEDVKLLDAKGILVNRLSTDGAVADLFNKLCVQIHYASDTNYLADVFVRATEYYGSKWPRWRAQLVREYFGSPWAGVAVVAAVLLFLLTIEQSVFAAISYFRPP